VALEPTAPVQVWLWWLATAALIAGAGYVAYKKRDGGNGSAGDAAAGGGVGSGSTSRRGEPGVSGGGGGGFGGGEKEMPPRNFMPQPSLDWRSPGDGDTPSQGFDGGAEAMPSPAQPLAYTSMRQRSARPIMNGGPAKGAAAAASAASAGQSPSAAASAGQSATDADVDTGAASQAVCAHHRCSCAHASALRAWPALLCASQKYLVCQALL
jgi:hypothetical protein